MIEEPRPGRRSRAPDPRTGGAYPNDMAVARQSEADQSVNNAP